MEQDLVGEPVRVKYSSNLAKVAAVELQKLGWSLGDMDAKECPSCRNNLATEYNYCPNCGMAVPVTFREDALSDLQAAITSALRVV